MSSVEIPLHGANAMLVMNGSFTFVDPVQPSQMRDPAPAPAEKKKRDRGEDLLLADDSEAAGWSSAILDRSLALRRRRGPSPSSFHRGCLVVTEAQNSRDQETAPEVATEEILECQWSEKEPSVEELVYWTVI